MASTRGSPTDDELREVLRVAHAVLRGRGVPEHEAKEVAQLTLIKVWDKWSHTGVARARTHGSWSSYVCTMAVNQHRDLIRSQQRRIKHERDSVDALESPIPERPGTLVESRLDPSGIERFMSEQVVQDLIRLISSPRQRECAELVYLSNLSIRQTAEVLGIQRQAVRKLMRDANKSMRDHFSAEL